VIFENKEENVRITERGMGMKVRGKEKVIKKNKSQ